MLKMGLTTNSAPDKSLHTNPAWKLFPCMKSLTQIISEVNIKHSFPWISNSFFLSCSWRSIIDHLLTHEKTMFKDLMTMQSSALKLYPSFEQKAMLLKRQAFAVFSGELDQYHLYLPLIQERLTENLRVGQTSLVAAQMFLFFRVLLLRISPQHLTSLWPIMVTELIQTFLQLEEDLTEEEEPAKSNSKISKGKSSGDGSGAEIQPNELCLYLAACKFLDTALSFPPDRMQLFQMYKWAFVPEVDTESSPVTSHLVENHQECQPHIVRIMDLLKMKYGIFSCIFWDFSLLLQSVLQLFRSWWGGKKRAVWWEFLRIPVFYLFSMRIKDIL
ncbi:PREDICTED: protein dopey-2-like isoform X3 [Sturnus vulgaris]|uniref:protein dopey-2-like isoform X3 n=1 Tax=Sturnus vulgaris TaxID=9172 RepID=UPI00071A22CE|nr:PREDICTED: protein dopey-2-like isoform X3 [Sturnus vulgaris]